VRFVDPEGTQTFGVLNEAPEEIQRLATTPGDAARRAYEAYVEGQIHTFDGDLYRVEVDVQWGAPDGTERWWAVGRSRTRVYADDSGTGVQGRAGISAEGVAAAEVHLQWDPTSWRWVR